MRALFGVLSLLLALAIVGLLARKQLTAVGAVSAPAIAASAASATPGIPALQPSGTYNHAQSQLLQQQVRQSVEATLQAPRPMPEDPP